MIYKTILITTFVLFIFYLEATSYVSLNSEQSLQSDRIIPHYDHNQQCIGYSESNGNETTFYYDESQRVKKVTRCDNGGINLNAIHYSYDKNHNKTKERHTLFVGGQAVRTYTTQWTYDSHNRIISQYEGLESPHPKHTYYTYNCLGKLEKLTKPDGIVLIYAYNEKGALSSWKASDNSFSYCYHYDELGHLVAIEDLIQATIIKRHYNVDDLLVEEHIGSLTFRNEWDSKGHRQRFILPDGSKITYQYVGDSLKAVQRYSIDQELLYEHLYHYDHHTLKITESRLIGDLGSLVYHYNTQGLLTSISSKWWSQSIPSDGYDDQNHLTKFDVQDRAGSYCHTLAYSADRQLIKEEGPFKESYTHDSLYNRLSQNQSPFVINELNQLVETPTALCRYDQNGNLIEKVTREGTWEYTYDALDRLIRVVKRDQQAVDYIYDTFHRRLNQTLFHWDKQQKKWVREGTEWFLYDEDKEIGKLDKSGKLVELRVLGQGEGAEIGAAIALELEGEIYAPIHNHGGSVCSLVHMKSGEVIESYRYSAYGQEQLFNGAGESLSASACINPWRFFSKRYDSISNGVFFGRRLYDPELGRWTTPDPLHHSDTPNVYAFLKNNPMNEIDPYGLVSIRSIYNKIAQTFYDCYYYMKKRSHRFPSELREELGISDEASDWLLQKSISLFGEHTFLLMGYYSEEPDVGKYGELEINDQVRITFINGILTTRQNLIDNLVLISKSHGDMPVHYVYRPTEGFTWDISNALWIKLAYTLGFRSLYAHLLAKKWKALIEEMGGVNGGGTIIHYAHSLGGSDTDRARDLLTPEEQKMIRVFSFGSATLIRNQGFQSVMNYVSFHDGVSMNLFFEPFGHLRNLFDPNRNVHFKGFFPAWPCWPVDHLLGGPTYQPLLLQLGELFIKEYGMIKNELKVLTGQ